MGTFILFYNYQSFSNIKVYLFPWIQFYSVFYITFRFFLFLDFRYYMQYLLIYSILFCATLYFGFVLMKSAILSAIISISINAQAYLLLSGAATALGELAVVVHGGGSAARGFPALSSFRIQHPPWAFPRALVLYAYEPTVQRQIVTNGVLQKKKPKSHVSDFSNRKVKY